MYTLLHPTLYLWYIIQCNVCNTISNTFSFRLHSFTSNITVFLVFFFHSSSAFTIFNLQTIILLHFHPFSFLSLFNSFPFLSTSSTISLFNFKTSFNSFYILFYILCIPLFFISLSNYSNHIFVSSLFYEVLILSCPLPHKAHTLPLFSNIYSLTYSLLPLPYLNHRSYTISHPPLIYNILLIFKYLNIS